MKAVIDSCSLVSLVRYYLPFDKDAVLFNYMRDKIACGDIIILDKILEECRYVSKGIVLESLHYLKDPVFLKSGNLAVNTEPIFPPAPAKFLRQLDNQFVCSPIRNKINDVEYETLKVKFMDSADMKLILFCLNHKNEGLFDDDVVIVTEETGDNNDSKLFRKIPVICKVLGIKTLSLPQFLSAMSDIDVRFSQ